MSSLGGRRAGDVMNVAVKVMRLGCAALAAALSPTGARAQSVEADLKSFAVHVNRTPQQSWPGYGIYLGNGLILTASHVPGPFAAFKPHVVIAGQDLPAGLVREGNLEGVDLTLLSVDPTGLPVRLRMRRMPLCERAPYAGEAVVVAIPEGTARSGFCLPRRFRPSSATVSALRSPTSPPPETPAPGCSTPPTFACSGSSAGRFPSAGHPQVLACRSRRQETSPSISFPRLSSKLSFRPASHFSLGRAGTGGDSGQRGTAVAARAPVKFG
jgi:hypothetical protein